VGKKSVKHGHISYNIFFSMIILFANMHSSIHAQQEAWATVFIHGIMSIKPHLSLSNFMRFMRDKIDDTVYAKTVQLMRLDEFFYYNQVMDGYGLHEINIYDRSRNNASSAIASFYNTVQNLVEPNGEYHYYTYGWSGLLSSTHRYLDAKKLFEALEHLSNIFQKQGKKLRIRLIGYSHGGNVLLNLAAIRQDFYPDSTLIIDEALLLGVPIQTETDYLIIDPIFDKIYHIYSEADRIQCIDFFSFNRFFSRRHFKHRQTLKIPKNLTQVKLKLMRLTKSRYPLEQRIRRVSNYKDAEIISGTSPYLRDASPGHIEMWFFGWAPQHYRRAEEGWPGFILEPLPVVIFLPYVIHYIQQVAHNLVNPRPVTVDIRPELDVMLIKQYNPKRFCQIFPFVPQDIRDMFADTAYAIRPLSYTLEEYNDHISIAYRKAIAYYQDQQDKLDLENKSYRYKRSRKRGYTHK